MTNRSENGIRLSHSAQEIFHNSLKQGSLFRFPFSFILFRFHSQVLNVVIELSQR